MSEVQTRGSSTRGRGGFRGGRGGYRGSRGGKSHSSRDEQENSPPLEDQGEVGELKARYADKLPMMREICEGWSDEDLVFALQETNGDEVAAMDRITSGTFLPPSPLKLILTVGRFDFSVGRGQKEASKGERVFNSS